jgi:hypothetical protein
VRKRPPRLRHGVALALLLALIAGPLARAHAAGFDLTRLMALLGQTPEGEVSYTEEKTSSLLARPLTSAGTLSFHRPDSVEKDVATPHPERYRIAGEELTVTSNGIDRRYALSSQPALAALAASLRGVLLGDEAQLRRYFQPRVEGDEQAWRLELTPIDATMGRYVRRVVVSGKSGRLLAIDTDETSGDHSALRVR